ncbi:hypothetical protein BH23PAT2_BH23PAT2_06260 [soil metagenome]
MHRATLQKSIQLSDDTYSFYFKTQHPIRYEAGQFVELKLQHSTPDNRGDSRWFTLSSAPTEELIAITTRLPNSSLSSFKKALSRLQPGDTVNMSEPMGDFILPLNTRIPIVFVAFGIGCTPMKSMIQYLIDTNQTRPITMLYALHSPEDAIFKDTFETYTKQFSICSSQTGGSTTPTQRLTAQTIVSTLNESAISDARMYISGPEEVIASLPMELAARGVPKHHILTDYFHGYTN